MTLSCRNDAEVQRRLAILQQDNVGIATRPMYKQLVNKVLPSIKRVYRTTKLPSELDEQETKYLERVLWPRSRYMYKVLLQQCAEYTKVEDKSYKEKLLLSGYKHPFCKSERHSFDASLERNKRALDKGAGLPKFGKKKDALPSAKQYVEEVIKPAGSIERCYSIFPGYRTQQSSEDDPKVRLVWQVPVTQWYMECEAYDDGISRTISKNKEATLDVKTFYCEPKTIKTWFKDKCSRVRCWVSGDATQYDSDVGKSELSTSCRALSGNYEFSDLLVEYTTKSNLVLPEGDLVRDGGQPSGSKQTNWGDGFTNVEDTLETIEDIGLLKFLICILVNGDDITTGFSTRITEKNLSEWSKYTRRCLNPDKCHIGQTIWNSKWYIDENIMTRPIFRVLNSMMFKEHETDPITGSKQYVAISIAQQIEDIAEHPLADEFIRLVKSIDQYPIDKFTESELLEYADAYLSSHSWMEEAGQLDSAKMLVSKLKRGTYSKQ